MTEGSRSTNTLLGTCFPPPVSAKNVEKESSPRTPCSGTGIWPSGWIPCSKQYSSQQALPIWQPAWPTWTEIHSRWKNKIIEGLHKNIDNQKYKHKTYLFFFMWHCWTVQFIYFCHEKRLLYKCKSDDYLIFKYKNIPSHTLQYLIHIIDDDRISQIARSIILYTLMLSYLRID